MDAHGIISRPRPRPRPRTPGSTSSPLSTRSYSPHATDSRHSESPRGSLHEVDLRDISRSPSSKSTHWDRSGTPSSVKSESVPDPFTNVDPFGKDPFKDMPDPFSLESPSSDPFTSDFNKEQVFHTQAVTAEPDPFAQDPFSTTSNQSSTSTIHTVSSTSSPGRHATSQETDTPTGSLGSLNVKAELQAARTDFLGDLIQNQFQTLGSSSGSSQGTAFGSSGVSNGMVTATVGTTASSSFSSRNTNVFNQSEDQNSVNWKDGDSSSNSEISDAFSADGCYTSASGGGGSGVAVGGTLANGVGAAAAAGKPQQPKPFAQAFQTNSQVQ